MRQVVLEVSVLFQGRYRCFQGCSALLKDLARRHTVLRSNWHYHRNVLRKRGEAPFLSVFVAELQSLLAEWQIGRRGSARHIMSWQNPLHTRQNFFKGGFGLLGARHIFGHEKFQEKVLMRKSLTLKLAELR